MAAITKLHICPQGIDNFSFREQPRNGLLRQGFSWSGCGGVHKGRHGLCLHRCRSFRSEDEGEVEEKQNISGKKCRVVKENENKLKKEGGFGRSDSQSNEKYTKAETIAKVEEISSSIAIQPGRYIITMMTTGVVLAVGFQLSGGDSKMNTLIWCSWLGGIDKSVKVVGISCDVCEPSDVQKLANFAVNESGSIDMLINNAGTNKGFRPLLQFTDEDIKQWFNIIYELPETVARTLAPRMQVAKGSWLRQGRWFDDQGRASYAAEADRLRNWAENRAGFSFTDAMEMYAENT
ncbi:hypothetical protein P3X46_019411 [Hevea brasiliensis]|uniref:Uncharacterized protein n=1 Tax=Hevea brasiliensis TaxID=3981 RepID=A0ABQ9LKH9_HEVBR|nr:hypothetical protein P3X46_019411 [Hevea brasiliensis]